jgi:hypothetical protein
MMHASVRVEGKDSTFDTHYALFACELSECSAALCQKVGRLHSLRVDWLVKPGEQKRTTQTGLFARSDQKRGKPACGGHLALLSTGGQSFGTKQPIILTNDIASL